MGDPETTEEAVGILKEFCPLSTVLKEDKPCPYFGFTGTCRDCRYDWMTVMGDVLKVVKVRRATYEKEREKNAGLSERLVELETASKKFDEVKQAFRAILQFGHGLLEEEQEDGACVGSEGSESTSG
jgi:hypothetical protein